MSNPILPRVTLICADTVEPWKALFAIQETLKQITPARTIFFTNVDVPEGDYEVVSVEINSIDEYSQFILKELWVYVETEYVLIIQADGYVLDGLLWTDDFLSVDYIGAKWFYSDNNVGNGGFSLRSKKLLKACLDPMIHGVENEDHLICRTFRGYLEDVHGIVFSDEKLADKFSFELNRPEQPTFGFHKNNFAPFKKRVLIKRDGAMGDVVMVEPIIDHFIKEGWDVSLKTNKAFYGLFAYYRHEIYSSFPKGTYQKTIDLNMAYEVDPKKSVFESYCKAAGIKMEKRNPYLGSAINPEKKLFKKYAIIHSPVTDLPYRNAAVDNWDEVIIFLLQSEYDVFQVSGSDIAPQINTPNPETLCEVISNADLFIGVDSGPLQIAVAHGVPAIGLFGSVDWRLRYQPSGKLKTLTGNCPKQNCYHESIGTTGTKCILEQVVPQCTIHKSVDIIKKIKE